MRENIGTNKLTDRERAEILIDAINGDELPPELAELVQGWLASDCNRDEKERYLGEVFRNEFEYDRNPPAWVYRKLDEFRSAAGLGRRAKRSNLRRNLRRTTIAAAILLPAVAAAYMFVLNGRAVTDTPPTVAQVTIAASPGSQHSARLTDGSDIWLREGTTLTHPETFGDRREVGLDGEAYFEVAHDPDKPFVVNTGHVSVKVLGTKFNITAYPDADFTTVSLHEGSVEVTGGKYKVMLKPNERATYYHHTGDMIVEVAGNRADAEWRKDYVTINNGTLNEILARIGDFYGKRISVDDRIDLDMQVRLNAQLSKHSVDSIMQVLQLIANDTFRYEITDDTITIIRR